MKYNFSAIVLKDIEGKEAPDLKIYKPLADAIYKYATNLDLVEKAMAINSGKEVELDKLEIEQIKQVVGNEKVGFFAFTQKAILDYIDGVKENASKK